MRRSGKTSAVKIGLRCRCAALALGLLALAGCVAPKPPSDERPLQPVPNVPDRPEVVTDLSKLSAADTTAVALPPVLPTVSPLQSTSNVSVGASRNEQLTHKLAAGEPGRYDTETPSSDTQAPGGTRLLNDKARQYANFSDILLTQTMRAALTLEPEKLGSKRVPLELTPVVLTAIMDPEGRLKEIVIEHHSGDLAVDRLFIEACKQGIWSRNPPVGARSVEGTYRVQIQGSVSNRTFDRYGQYTYSTEIGLAIL